MCPMYGHMRCGTVLDITYLRYNVLNFTDPIYTLLQSSTVFSKNYRKYSKILSIHILKGLTCR